LDTLSYDKFIKKPRIEGKLIGLTTSQQFHLYTKNHFSGSTDELSGIGYFPKFIFISLMKDFNISKVKVAVKYPGESELRDGITFFSPKTSINMEGESNTKTLTIPSEEHIISLLTFERNKPVSVFIPFCVSKPTPTHQHFESIKITFTAYDGMNITICFDKEDIDAKNMMFEEKYWS